MTAQHCPSCGAENREHARFCDACGKPIGTSAAPAPRNTQAPPRLEEHILAEQTAAAALPSADGERKTITALFADIKGSMELIEDLDPEEARAVVDPALELMMSAVHRYGGYVAQSTGDGIFALFGAPIAQEDHAVRAVYAALRMQEENERYAQRLRRERGITLQIRVGLNSGEVVLRSIQKDDLHADYTPVGHSTGLAARMQALARPGAVVVSEHTQRLVEGYFELASLGPAKVKGASAPVAIYEVVGVGPMRTRLQRSARRGLVPFVGRRAELERLRRALELARSGRGQIVALVGEPGVGKSRLTHELKLLAGRTPERRDRAAECLLLETSAAAYGRSHPYLPVVALLKDYFAVEADDDERRRREKVIGRALSLDRSLDDALPYLLALLEVDEPEAALDPQLRRRRTFDALIRLLLRESRNRLVLLIVEDLQWLDAETESFLEELAKRLPTERVLLLVNYRPEYRSRWSATGDVTEMRLEPLAGEEAEALVHELLGVAPELEPLRRLLLEKTGGNPFFIEEIVQSLFDDGALRRAAARTVLTRDVAEIHVPASVQAILAARIDRLATPEKTLLQILAVVGRECALPVVERLCESVDELPLLLARLRAAELIFEEPGYRESKVVFKHALTQEVAYQSQLQERRRALHERTAAVLESIFRDRIGEHYAELAFHYGRSGNREKAVQYLHDAGDHALRRSAFAEAAESLTEAARLIQTLPSSPERVQQELMVQIMRGRALTYASGTRATTTEEAFGRARELARQVEDSARRLIALAMLSSFSMARGDYRAAHEMRAEALQIAQTSGQPVLLRAADHMIGQVLFHLGDFAAARGHLDHCVDAYQEGEPAFYEPLGVEDPRVGSLAYLGLTLWYLGYPDQALARSREALAIAERVGHPFSLAYAHLWLGDVHALRGEWAACDAHGEALVALSAKHGLPLWAAEGNLLKSWSAASSAAPDAAVDLARAALDAVREAAGHLSPFTVVPLAELYLRARRVDEGLALLEQAEAAMSAGGERLAEAELHRVKGALLLARGDGVSAAEECLRQAIAVARKQQAKSLELRAATALADESRARGEGPAAARILTEVYRSFTEGIDTADPRAAKALLDTLG